MLKTAQRSSRGFTLIELLIVIAVIGILAVAVLSAINPVEQIKKANDSRRRSNAAELLNGLERYYTTFSAYPSGLSFATASPGSVFTSSDAATLGNEMKPEFGARIAKSGDSLYVYKDSTDLVHICFQIESKQQQAKYGTGLSSGSNFLTCLPE